MTFSEGVFTLFLVDFAKAIPRIVMPLIGCDGSSVSSERFIVFLVRDMFVTLQSEGICEFGIELSGAFEAFERLIVVTLQGEGVPDGAPGLWRVPVRFNDLVAEEGEVDLVLEMPEDCRVDFHVFKTGGCHGLDASEVLLGFGVERLFEECAAYLGENPGRVSLARGDGIEELESFITLVMA